MRTRLAGSFLLAAALIFIAPATADAQWRSHGVWFIGPSWWQPYPYPYPYGRYPYRYRADVHSVALRLDVDRKDAEVYVDGYYAGIVDDFDGVFQRLRVTPGEHDITIFLPGYRTLHERRYFNPDAYMRLRLTMEPLRPGDPQDPKPVPVPPPSQRGRPEPPRRADEPERIERPERRERFGTISLRVQPADAEILIDGERWTAPAGEGRIAIELAAGRHRIEVRKDGYRSYTEEVLIRPNATLTLNVSLSR